MTKKQRDEYKLDERNGIFICHAVNKNKMKPQLRPKDRGWSLY